ncbi:GumC family protein [Bryobacter aggregatus]|uniref:GumC family protein n=1 Tax=Bryobacter aggregatus TaxID=360054 RepID=UPI0004E28292|nr:polysaccharide biosynthesis tyrosine autokinase [Bryobacter aggregatus]
MKLLGNENLSHSSTSEHLLLGSPAVHEPQLVTASWCLDILRRRKWTVAIAILMGGLAGLAIGIRAVPRYIATAVIEIQDYNSSFLNQKEMQVTADAPQQLSDVYLQSQLTILTSNTISSRVVDRLALDQDRAFTSQSESVAEQFVREFGLQPWLNSLDGPEHPSVIRRIFSLRPPGVMNAKAQAIEVLKKNLSAKPLPQSRMVQIAFASPDPKVSKLIVDTVAMTFSEFNGETRIARGKRTEDLLRHQIASAKAELDGRQADMQNYARISGLVILGGGTHAAEEKLRQVQADLTRIGAERAAREAELKISSTVSPETLGNVLDNPTIRDHSARLAAVRQELAENAALFTSDFPKVKRLAAQVKELERTLQSERDRLVQRIRNDYNSAVVRERLAAASYLDQTAVISEEAAKRVHYDSLKRDLEAGFSTYHDMTGRLQTAEVATALQSSNIRIVDAATVSALPGKPNLQLLLAFGLVCGLGLGVTAALWRERYELQRDGYQLPGQSPRRLLLPELGVIPAIQRTPRVAPWWSGNSRDTLSHAMAQSRGDASMVAEAYMSLGASILMDRSGQPVQALAFISDLPGSGKSTTVVNLAKGLAGVGKKVLIIDGDLRRPRLHTELNVPNNWGVSTLIAVPQELTLTPLNQLVRQTEIPGLCLLPSGPGVANPAKLLASGTLDILMQRLRREFDMVLIDTPPASLFADARFLGRQADGSIFVIRSRHNDPEEINRILQCFRKDRIPIIGTVLNEWRATENGVYRAAYAAYAT